MQQHIDRQAQQVLNCLKLQYDVTTPAADRQRALETLEQISNGKDAPMVGHRLFSRQSGLSDEVRFFGLRCMENALKYKWNDGTYDLAERVQIRGLIEDAMMTGLAAATEERSMIKEKVAALWIELAKREWPHNWDLNQSLMQAFATNPNAQETTFLVLKGLAEDIYDQDYADEVVNGRKKVLMRALNSIVLTEKEYSEQIARDMKPHLRQAKEVIYVPPQSNSVGWFAQIVLFMENAAPRLPQQTDAVLVRLLTSAVRALSAFLPWISAKMMAEAQILERLCSVLSVATGTLRLNTTECIYLACYRSYSTVEEMSALFDPIFAGGWRFMITSIQQLSVAFQASGAQDDNTAVKLLAQSLIEVGERHLCWRKNITWHPVGLADYMSALMELHKHPSLVVAAAPMPFWLAALRHELISKTSELQAQLPSILEQLLVAFRKSYPLAGTVSARYIQQDFNSSRDAKAQLASQVNHARLIVRLITMARPVDTLSWLHGQITAALQSQAEAQLAARQFRSCLQLLEAAAPMLAKYVGGHTSQPEAAAISQEMLVLIQEIANGMATTVVAVIDALAASAYFLRFDTSLLHAVLQKIIELTAVATEGQADLRDMRFIALGSLVKFADSLPDNLMEIFDQLKQLISDLMSQGAVRYSEQHYLQEFLTVTVLRSNVALERKMAVMQSIVEPLLADWLNATRAALQSTATFMTVLGVDFLESIVRDVDAGRAKLIASNAAWEEDNKQVQLAPAVSLNAILKRWVDFASTQSGMPQGHFWASYSVSIYETGLQLVSALHQLRDPGVWASYSAQTKSVLSLPGYLRQTYLRPDGVTPKQGAKPPGFFTYTEQLQHFLEQVQPTVYTLLGQIAATDSTIYARYADLSNAVVSSVFATASHIHNRHWTALLKCFVQPFVQHCPTDQRAAVLCTVLPALLSFLREKLDAEWAKVAAKAVGEDADDEDDGGLGGHGDEEDSEEVSEEIYADKQLRLQTCTLVDMVSAWVVPKGVQDSNNKKRQTAAECQSMIDFLLSHPTVMEPLMFAVLSVLRYRDTQSLLRSLNILRHLTPQMAQRADFHPFIASTVVQYVLQALRDGYHKDAHDSLIGYLVKIVEALEGDNTLVFQTFLAAGVPQAKLEDAYRRLGEETGPKEAIMKELLNSITGVTVAEAGKREKSFAIAHVNKVLVMPKSIAEDAGDSIDFGDLFDETNVLDSVL
ncbi:karyopherin [Sorochytrium milnesiophthora]